MPFVHSFGVPPRPPADQIVNAVAYPRYRCCRLHARCLQPWRAQPSGDRGCVALMRGSRHDGLMSRRDRDGPGGCRRPGPVYWGSGAADPVISADHRLSLDRAQVLEWRGEEIGGAPTTGGAGTEGGAVTWAAHRAAGELRRGVGGGQAGRGFLGRGVSAEGASRGGAGIRATSASGNCACDGLARQRHDGRPACSAGPGARGSRCRHRSSRIPVIKPLTRPQSCRFPRQPKVVTAETTITAASSLSETWPRLARRPLRRIGLATPSPKARAMPRTCSSSTDCDPHIVDTGLVGTHHPGLPPASPADARRIRTRVALEGADMVQNYARRGPPTRFPGATLGTDRAAGDFARLGPTARVRDALARLK
jgi:hypothetical protein